MYRDDDGIERVCPIGSWRYAWMFILKSLSDSPKGRNKPALGNVLAAC